MDFSEENGICRLCLKNLTENCEPITEIIHHSLNFITLFPNLAISDDPMVCETCAANLKKCFDFKATCLSTEDCITSFAEGEAKKVDIRDIYSKIKLDGNIDRIPDDFNVCRFCLELVKDNVSPPVKHEINFIEILQKYFIEMDVSITDNIVACTPCCDSLRVHDSFVTNYVSIEEKIEEYCKVEGVNYKGLVDLRDVASFVSKKMLNVENINSLDKDDKSTVNTNVDIKVKFEGFMDVKQEKEELIDEELQERNDNSFQHHPSSSQSDYEQQLTRVEPTTYLCKIYGYQNDRSRSRLQEHILVGDKILVAIHYCAICQFQADTKDSLRNHMLMHGHSNTTDVVKPVNMYKCDWCDYEAKWRSTVETHMLIHKSPSEITMYKCDRCDYQAKLKASLKTHMLIHKTPLETTMYKCEICAYETKYKTYLQSHMLVHMDVSQMEMHKCELCPYKAKWKGSLRKHMLAHKQPSEVVTRVTMHKCQLCSYETKDKANLKKHMLIHKSPSEITMYKCEMCAYETKQKPHLKEHMLIHMDMSRVEMHKCEFCPFKTKRKCALRKHRRSHTLDVGRQGTMHKCDLCEYETNEKSNLKRHMLTHKPPSEITRYKCDLCDYNSMQKGNVKRHMLTHKTSSETTMNKSEAC